MGRSCDNNAASVPAKGGKSRCALMATSALVTGTPVIPFCYAEKSEQLCNDMQLGESRRVTAFDLATDAGKLARAWEAPHRISDDAVQNAARGVLAALNKVRDALAMVTRANVGPDAI